MKFTCDSCNAQYMISDDKVGPAGVKVRCKKCGKIVTVRRAVEQPQTPAKAAPAQPEVGLDVELGQAFDSVFSDRPAAAAAPAAEEGARTTEAPAPQPAAEAPAQAVKAAPAPTEWYVAIGQAQVGPLPLEDVKRKWEAGEIGPDSLVWRPGMADWQPLSSVADLAGYLAPVPRAAARVARPAGQATREKAAAPAPAADATWKPAGASALAALASEEIAAVAPPEAKGPQSPVPSGVKSLVDVLPDGGGVDPTGAIPLPIKALETTGEKKLERRSTVAHRAEEARHRRSAARAVAVGVVLVVAVVAAGAGGVVWYTNRKLAAVPPPVAAAPAPAPAAPAAGAAAAAPAAPAAPAAATPAAEPAAGAAPTAAAAPEPQPASAAPAPAARPAPAPEPAPAVRRPAAEKPKEEAPARVARQETARRQTTVARAAPGAKPEPPEPPPAPAPSRPAAPKRDSLLDFGSSDSALDEALGRGDGGSGRSVYVPPARAGSQLPDKLTPAQINEAVAGRIDSLRRCVSEQKARDPSASGVLKMRWIIGADGGVRDVKCLTPEYAQGPFAQCISGVVKTIRFPKSSTTGQEVTFPFSF